MRKEEFYIAVKEMLEKRLGASCQVRLQSVTKNNGVMLQGLVIVSGDRNVYPTIYLSPFYEAYCHGTGMEEILATIEDVLHKETPKESIDMSFFLDYEKVRDRICYRLVSEEKNRDLLDKIPSLPFLDLVISFYYSYRNAALGEGSILIRLEHLDKWGVTVQELWKAASENTPRLYPAQCRNILDVVQELMPGPDREREFMGDEYGGEMPARESFPMHVITNRQRVNGASVILYQGYLEELAGRMGGDLYLIPSSIHEMLVIPASEISYDNSLKDMVSEVNATVVEPQEILSDHVYYYDHREKRVGVVVN